MHISGNGGLGFSPENSSSGHFLQHENIAKKEKRNVIRAKDLGGNVGGIYYSNSGV